MIEDIGDLGDDRIIVEACVIGSGPTGQAAALELAEAGMAVLILEAGRRSKDVSLQWLAVADGASRRGAYPDSSTHRDLVIGGTSRRWEIATPGFSDGIRYTSLAPVDLAVRPGIEGSGWPISWDEYSAVLPRAREICGLRDVGPEAENWTGDGREELDLGHAVESHVFQVGRGARFQPANSEAINHPLVRVIEGAWVTQLRTNAAGSTVTSIEASSWTGRRIEVSAGVVVCALSSIGNTHLLLRSTDAGPGGLGNHADHLGRYFMDHPMSRLGVLHPHDTDLYDELGFYDVFEHQGAQGWAKLSPTDAEVLGRELLGTTTALFPMNPVREAKRRRWLEAEAPVDRTQAVPALRQLAAGLKSGRLSGSVGHLAKVLSGPDDLVRYVREQAQREVPPHGGFNEPGWASRPRPDGGYRGIELIQVIEQTPHPDSRIVLTDACDRFGQPRFRIDWVWNPEDERRLTDAHDLLCEGLAKIGEVERPNGGVKPKLIRNSAHHHGGTTRMSARPEDGVVDPWGRIHGCDNAWVVGSSIFPTIGYANPTLSDVVTSVRAAADITG